MFSPGPLQLLIVGIVALLLFGNRLPEVARSLGKSMVEFKRGMQGVQDEFKDAVNTSDTAPQVDHSSTEASQPATPKFVPPTSPPQGEKVEAKVEAN